MIFSEINFGNNTLMLNNAAVNSSSRKNELVL